MKVLVNNSTEISAEYVLERGLALPSPFNRPRFYAGKIVIFSGVNVVKLGPYDFDMISFDLLRILRSDSNSCRFYFDILEEITRIPNERIISSK